MDEKFIKFGIKHVRSVKFNGCFHMDEKIIKFGIKHVRSVKFNGCLISLFIRCIILLCPGKESPRKGYGSQKLRAHSLGYHPFTRGQTQGPNPSVYTREI
jgi:hypothetical protein